MPANKAEEQAHQQASLIRRAQAGEAEAVAELYHRHAPAIFRYFLFRVSDRQTAEDLAGEVFLKMVQALPHYEDRGLPFAAWLFSIARARAVDHHRRAALRQAEALSEHLPSRNEEGDTEGAALRLLENDRLQTLISQLTEEQQMVIQLRFIEGYNLDETAQLMGKTAGAIKALQHRALRQLARKWDQP